MRAKTAVIVSLLSVLLGSVLCLGALNKLSFDNFLIETYDGRLLAMATSVRTVYTQALTLGLPLREFEGGRRVVEETAGSDNDVRLVATYDRVGDRFEALHGTVRPGNPLPESWERAMRRDPAAQFWQIESEDGFGILVPIQDVFEHTAGLIALIYARDQVRSTVDAFARLLWWIAVATTVPVAVLLVPGSLWAVGPVVRRLPEWTRFCAAFAATARDGEAGAATDEKLPPEDRRDGLADLLRAPFQALAARRAGQPVKGIDAQAGGSGQSALLLRRVRLRVLSIAILGMLLAGAGSTALVARLQVIELPRILAAKDVTVASILGSEIAHAVDLGIPVQSLRGLDALLTATRKDNPELGFLLVTDTGGKMLGATGTTPTPATLDDVTLTTPGGTVSLSGGDGFSLLAMPVTTAHGTAIGKIYLGIDSQHIARLIRDRLFDVITVLVITGICALELLLLLLDQGILEPIRALSGWGQGVLNGQALARLHRFGFREFARLLDDASAAVGGVADSHAPAVVPWQMVVRYIRVALFLFVVGDSLSMAFLPLFAREVTEPFLGISKQSLLSLPVMVYWLASAVAQLLGASLMERMAHRSVFAVGGACSAAGLVVAAISHSMPELLAARILSGIGLGLVFAICQAAILTHVPSQLRTLGVATFTGTFFLATFCGTAMGGIAAQQAGFRGAFVLSACVVSAAALFALAAFGASRERPVPRRAAAAPQSNYVRLGRNRRFASLLLLCAVPNRAYNVALLFYLAPLYMYSTGSSKPEIGRAICIYGIVMALLAPVLAAFVDHRRWQARSVVFGSVLCGVGGAFVMFSQSYGVTIAIALMGIGQALSVPSQMSLVPQVAASETQTMGIPRVMSLFRIGERMPAFLAPVAAQALVSGFGYANAIAGFGIWVGLSALILATVLFGSRMPMPGKA